MPKAGFRNIKASDVKYVEVMTGRAGESLIRVGAVGIRIWKTPPRFPNYLGRRTNFPPHPQLPNTPPGKHIHQGNIFTLPRQNHPPNTGKPPQYRPQLLSREGATAPGGSKRHQRGATDKKYGSNDRKNRRKISTMQMRGALLCRRLEFRNIKGHGW